MRNVFYAALTAMLLVSCKGELEYNPKNTDNLLVINALIDAGEEDHFAQVAISTNKSVRSVNSAHLRCFVNGKLVDETSALEKLDEYHSFHGHIMRFKASFKEGDSVRLEVEADNGKFSAFSEQVVPPPAIIEKVDTAWVSHNKGNNGYSDSYIRFDIKIKDISEDDDYYFLNIISNNDCELYSGEEYIRTTRFSSSCKMDIDNDIILNEGHITSGDSDDSIFEMGETNYMGVFSDSRFNGGSATIHPFVNEYSFMNYNYELSGDESIVIKTTAVVKVSSIGKRYFYYLKALNQLYDGSVDLALEDVSIPDTVEGGIGFVGISNPSTVKIALNNLNWSPWVYDE